LYFVAISLAACSRDFVTGDTFAHFVVDVAVAFGYFVVGYFVENCAY
jgi:hypothetical protein